MAEDDISQSNLGFAEEATVYVSASQNGRVLTEGWIAAKAFCPSCGAETLRPFPNNSPVADFSCPNCAEEYELKAKRDRLGPNARRAGWQRCNILIGQVPAAGRIPLIRNGLHVPKAAVLDQWRSTLFLRDAGLNARGWLLAAGCWPSRRSEKLAFTLDEVYAHEAALAALYPGNSHVKPKIRQQLQVLRDPGSGPGWLADVRRARTYRRV